MITSLEELPPLLAASVSAEEKKYITETQGRGLLPFAVTEHFASLARPEKDDPIRRQFFPDSREALRDPFALDDPLGENQYRVAPRLVHQYKDRALLLAANTCAGYCRHCFRRFWLSAPPPLSVEVLRPALAYLTAHTEIRELLVSGGDPLTLDNTALEDLFRRLRAARPDLLLRVCTRVPVTEPSRFDTHTIALLANYRPLRVVVHINHPRELSAPARACLGDCVNADIPVLMQTVLLRGINDEPELLAQLFSDCLELGLSPYYLFQLDLAPNTAHFRVPLKRGIEIYRRLGGLISAPGLPAYAVDLPGGGGKVRLHENVITGEKKTPDGYVYILKDNKGKEWYYPMDVPEDFIS
jgi:lysine 2,3-aminomutase